MTLAQQPDEQADRTNVLSLVSREHGTPHQTPPAEAPQETTTEIPAVTDTHEPDNDTTKIDGFREWVRDLIHERPASVAETLEYSRTGDWAPNPGKLHRFAHLVVTRLCNALQVYGNLLTRINTPGRLAIFLAAHLILITALATL